MYFVWRKNFNLLKLLIRLERKFNNIKGANMKKLFFTGFAISVFIILSSTSNAQIIRLGLGGGLTLIKSPDAFTNSIENNGLGFTNNYHVTLLAKLDLPLIPITPAAFIDYHILRGSGSKNSQSVTTSLNILSFGVEVQWIILPIPLVKPYVAADIAYNHFGQMEETSSQGTFQQSGMDRYGGAIGIGAIITALPVIDLDVSLKYHVLNLVGKDSGEDNINAITLNLILLL